MPRENKDPVISKRMELWRETKKPYETGYRIEHLDITDLGPLAIFWNFDPQPPTLGTASDFRRDEAGVVTAQIDVDDERIRGLEDEIHPSIFMSSVVRRRATQEEMDEAGVTEPFDIIVSGRVRYVSMIPNQQRPRLMR